MDFEMNQRVVVVSNFTPGTVFQDWDGTPITPEIRRGSYGTYHGQSFLGNNTLKVKFQRPEGISALIHPDYLIHWYNCNECGCCPGIYICRRDGQYYCQDTHHRGDGCCEIIRPGRDGDGDDHDTIRVGSTVALLKEPYSIFKIQGEHGEPTHSIPPVGTQGVVISVIPGGYKIDFGNRVFCCARPLVGKVAPNAIPPRNGALEKRCFEWAHSRYQDLGLCWLCQKDSREHTLNVRVALDDEAMTFDVIEVCLVGHERPLLQKLDLRPFV